MDRDRETENPNALRGNFFEMIESSPIGRACLGDGSRRRDVTDHAVLPRRDVSFACADAMHSPRKHQGDRGQRQRAGLGTTEAIPATTSRVNPVETPVTAMPVVVAFPVVVSTS